MDNKYRGLSFIGLQPDNIICIELKKNQSTNLNHPGFYFIHTLLNTGSLVTIYCGESLNSVKNRLDKHYEKLTNNNHPWGIWCNKNKINIKNIYFTAFNTPYGAAFENFIIFKSVSNLTFNLNAVVNGHNDLLDVSSINYNFQPFFAKFIYSMYNEGLCTKLITVTAQEVIKRIYGDSDSKLEDLIKQLNI